MALVGEEIIRSLIAEAQETVRSSLAEADSVRSLIAQESTPQNQDTDADQAIVEISTSEDSSEGSDVQIIDVPQIIDERCVGVEAQDSPIDSLRDIGATGDLQHHENNAACQDDVILGPTMTLNDENFECTICLYDISPGNGVVLDQCKHSFCKECLASLVKHCEESDVPCPFASTENSCRGLLLDAEIRSLVSQEVLDARDARSLRRAGFDLATGQLWPSLTETTKRDLVPNATRLECPLCFSAAPPGAAVVLKDCLHAFCRSCLTEVTESCLLEEVPCPCPSSDFRCESALLQEEVRALLGPAAYTRRMERALQHASEQRAARQMWHSLEAVGHQDLAPNVETFDCPICFCAAEPGEGVVLKECLHSFCRECLAGLVRHCDAPEVCCPFVSAEYSCQSTLTEKEIRALVSAEDYERHLARSLRQAEGNTANSFHCRTVSCAGWCEIEDTVNTFCCPVCTHVNCITCRAIHEDIDCRSYQEKLKEDARHNEDARKTQEYLQRMLASREAINCPVCRIVLMKKDGCDWMKCSACRNEVCWVTGLRRWGPRGPGDSSDGCKCRVNGKLCHPNCHNCH